MCNHKASELAAAINFAASVMSKGKSHEEVEIMAIAFDMLSDTLFSIARIARHQERICRKDKGERED